MAGAALLWGGEARRGGPWRQFRNEVPRREGFEEHRNLPLHQQAFDVHWRHSPIADETHDVSITVASF